MRGTGPIFLCINLALALVFAFWGLGLYRSRIDFAGKDGPFEQNKKEIARLQASVKNAEETWQKSLPPLVQLELLRPELQRWYADHLKNLREGTKVVSAVREDKGKPVIDAKGFPLLTAVAGADGKPIPGLKSIRLLHNDYMQVTAAIKQEMDQIEAKLREEQQLNEEIGNGQKGLRAVLAAEQLKERNSLEEQEDLKPLLYNRQVEAQLLAQRKKSLESRLQELQSVRVAQQP
jgi:hypothetical protein